VSTLATVEARYGVSHLDHLDKQAGIPVVSRVAFQGDVAILRRDTAVPATDPIPSAGFPVVRGESGGNTHAVYGNGFYSPAGRRDVSALLLGVLTVPVGEQVLLSHPEHGGFLIEPGTYELRRQREQADAIRIVAD
jgi:hypothetical protein